MTLHKSMWKAAVLAGIAGVLMFAGGATAALTVTGNAITLAANPSTALSTTTVTADSGRVVTLTPSGLTAPTGSSMQYRWLSVGTSGATTGGTAVAAANVSGNVLTVPTNLTNVGTKYYYVEARAFQATGAQATQDGKDSSAWANALAFTVNVKPVIANFATSATTEFKVYTKKTQQLTVTKPAGATLQWQVATKPKDLPNAQPAVVSDWTNVTGTGSDADKYTPEAVTAAELQTKGKLYYRCKATRSSGTVQVAADPKYSDTLTVITRPWVEDISTGYKLVILAGSGSGTTPGGSTAAKDTVYSGLQKKPVWTLRKGTSSTNNTPLYSSSTVGQIVESPGTPASENVAAVQWGSNVDAGPTGGEIKLILDQLTGEDNTLRGGFASANGDTLYTGTLDTTFAIGKLALTSNNIASWFTISNNTGKTYTGEAQEVNFTVTTSPVAGSIDIDEVTVSYKTGSNFATSVTSAIDAAMYRAFITIPSSATNFTGSSVSAGSSWNMEIKKAPLFTHYWDGAANNNAGAYAPATGQGQVPVATASVDISEDAYPVFNAKKSVTVPKTAVTVSLVGHTETIVPTADIDKVTVLPNDGQNFLAKAGTLVEITVKSSNFENSTEKVGNNVHKLYGIVNIKKAPVTKDQLTYTPPTKAQLVYTGKPIVGTVAPNTNKGADQWVWGYNAGDALSTQTNDIVLKFTAGLTGESVNPVDSLIGAKYYVWADVGEFATNPNYEETKDILLDSIVITRVALTTGQTGNITTYLNTAAVDTKILATQTPGSEIISGQEELGEDFAVELNSTASNPPASADFTGLGEVTMEFNKSKTATTGWSSRVPGNGGKYYVRIRIDAGQNFRSLASHVFTNQLEVKNDAGSSTDYTFAENAVTYGRGATYTFSGPEVSSSFGTLDSILYTAVTPPTGNTRTYKATATKANNGATFTISETNLSKAGVVDVGDYSVKATVYSSLKENGVSVQTWKSAELDVPFTINPRPIDTAGITIRVTAKAEDLVYKGAAITPTVSVTEGTSVLVKATTGNNAKDNDYETGDATLSPDVTEEINQTNAGAANLVVVGKGNYTGYVLVPFTIAKKTVTPAIVSVNSPAKNQDKVYDGTTFIDTVQDKSDGPWVKIGFGTGGLVGPAASEGVSNVDDYLITNASLSDANAGLRTVTATVSLVEGSDKMANYQFAGGATSATITGTASGTSVNITRLNPAGDNVSKAFDVSAFPVVRYFNDQVQTVNPSPELLPSLSLGGDGAYRILYYTGSGAALKDTVQPKAADTYEVRAYVTGTEANMNIAINKSSNEPKGYLLGTLTINPEAKPVFTPANGTPRDTTVRFGKSVGIKVGATAPAGSNGVLSYQWFQYASATANDTTGQLVGVGETYYYTATDTVNSVLYFGVKVTNTYDGYSTWKYAPRKAKVTVLEPPVSMANATFTVDSAYLAAGFTYTGSEIKLDVSKVKVQMPSTTVNDVVVPGKILIANKDFELVYTNNKNAGTATVVANGLDAYEDKTASKTFEIAKKTPTLADFTWNVTNVYTADTIGANVKSKDTTATVATLGALTVKYAGAATVPTNAGQYALTVDVAGGSNFNAVPGLVLGNYTITKAVIDTSWLVYSIPTGHKVGKPDTLGIGPVTMKKGTGVAASAITVKYNGLATAPTAAGKYNVTVDIIGGDNFFSAAGLALGVYEIGIGIASGNTKIPTAPKAAVVTVAPVKVAAASFTAGPSPVSKNGVIKFFSSKQVKSGSLYIFDANGNAVTKLSAKAGSGEIASWNLKDKKGVSVAEGSYVVKGALAAKDGTREKVSFVFSVVK